MKEASQCHKLADFSLLIRNQTPKIVNIGIIGKFRPELPQKNHERVLIARFWPIAKMSHFSLKLALQ